MNKIKLTIVLAITLAVLSGLPLFAQGEWTHDDWGNEPEIPDWMEWEVHSNHSLERCTNYPPSGEFEPIKKSCSNYHTSSPRSNETYCDMYRDGGTRVCDVAATVYCQGLGPASANGWLTFTGHCEIHYSVPGTAWPRAGAGYIGQTLWGAAQRGVECGPAKCGCIPSHPNGTPAQFFGNPVDDGTGTGTYYCQ